MGNVTVIQGRGHVIDEVDWQEDLYRSAAPVEKEVAITAVPYCVWDNREPGEMHVRLHTKEITANESGTER